MAHRNGLDAHIKILNADSPAFDSSAFQYRRKMEVGTIVIHVMTGLAGAILAAFSLLAGFGDTKFPIVYSVISFLVGCVLILLPLYSFVAERSFQKWIRSLRSEHVNASDLQRLHAVISPCPEIKKVLAEAVERSDADVLTYGVLLDLDDRLVELLKEAQAAEEFQQVHTLNQSIFTPDGREGHSESRGRA